MDIKIIWLNRLPDDKNLDWSKFEQFADENFKFDENSRKFSKRVENTEGKGEIARYEQFLLFPQCFQKAWFPGASKDVIVWEWDKCSPSCVDVPFETFIQVGPRSRSHLKVKFLSGP